MKNVMSITYADKPWMINEKSPFSGKLKIKSTTSLGKTKNSSVERINSTKFSIH